MTALRNSTPEPLAITAETMVREALCSTAVEAFGDKLRAVILVGSMARSESTVIKDGSRYRFLGDCDVVLLFQEEVELPSVQDRNNLVREIQKKLAEKEIVCSVSTATVRANYLCNLPPSIFTVEMRACAQVLWGDVSALTFIPSYGPRDITPEDGWRMLCNRLIESLSAATSITGARNPIEDEYLVAKLYLDMATSILVFAGQHMPTYRQRLSALEQLTLEDLPGFPLDLSRFVTKAKACTEWKLKPSTIPVKKSEVLDDCRRVLEWETRQLLQMEGTEAVVELVSRFSRQQPWVSRFRGWAYVMRATERSERMRNGFRWMKLFLKGSPRNLIYQAGIALLFGSERPELAKSVADLLPVARKGPLTTEHMAAAVMNNYSRFVTGTTS